MKTIRLFVGAGLVALLAVACGSSASPQGGLRQPCYANGTCNTGLTCISEVCVAAGGTAGTSAGGATGRGGTAGTSAGGTTGSGGTAGTSAGGTTGSGGAAGTSGGGTTGSGGAAGIGAGGTTGSGGTAGSGAGGSAGGAAGRGGSGGGAGGSTGAGGTGLPICAGQPYDPCNTASNNCASGKCQPASMGSAAYCTQNCNGPGECPNQNGQTVTCSGQGICRVTGPNTTCVAPGAGGAGGAAGTGGATGAGGGGATGTGGSGLPTCTGQIYDSCSTTVNNCASGMCRTFAGVLVCSQSCVSGSDCPTQDGQAVTCTGQGLCRPVAPNTTCAAP